MSSRLGYVAYVCGSNSATAFADVDRVDETGLAVTLSACTSRSFERGLLTDDRGHVARFASSTLAERCARSARWNNQTYGSAPAARLKLAECSDGLVAVREPTGMPAGLRRRRFVTKLVIDTFGAPFLAV